MFEKSWVYFSPPQAENFEDLGGCLMQKMPPDCTQERVFKSKMPKNSACGGHIIIEIRLVMHLMFFSRLPRAIIVCLCFMLVYRAPLHTHKTMLFLCAPAAAQCF